MAVSKTSEPNVFLPSAVIDKQLDHALVSVGVRSDCLRGLVQVGEQLPEVRSRHSPVLGWLKSSLGKRKASGNCGILERETFRRQHLILYKLSCFLMLVNITKTEMRCLKRWIWQRLPPSSWHQFPPGAVLCASTAGPRVFPGHKRPPFRPEAAWRALS